jgi:site-specific recombinase XerD
LRLIKIKGKGKRERVVPVNKSTINILARFIEKRKNMELKKKDYYDRSITPVYKFSL